MIAFCRLRLLVDPEAASSYPCTQMMPRGEIFIGQDPMPSFSIIGFNRDHTHGAILYRQTREPPMTLKFEPAHLVTYIGGS